MAENLGELLDELQIDDQLRQQLEAPRVPINIDDYNHGFMRGLYWEKGVMPHPIDLLIRVPQNIQDFSTGFIDGMNFWIENFDFSSDDDDEETSDTESTRAEMADNEDEPSSENDEDDPNGNEQDLPNDPNAPHNDN
ncbi:unnamed protein product [Caenorhabditis angaria]|uniref:Uncharacterized protein n=1 Tax=Caenorhabditis angaria TaxID=860376 RepID=A0A9P1N6D4_9PELO|nr:unnamed protein product [Caenorhabditis angaria]